MNCSYISDEICVSSDLSTFDPYDIWKTSIGLFIKKLYNKNRLLGGGPALFFTLFDLYINNRLRLGYIKQEYPIVRAMAAQILLFKYRDTNKEELLARAKIHLEWLKENSSKGYKGFCWGLGFVWPAGKNLIYDKNTPHSTHTPYALEAFHLYYQVTGNCEYNNIIKSCYSFFNEDIKKIKETELYIATSYGPFEDRIATNAVSYVMYSLAILSIYLPHKKEEILSKVQKLYNYIVSKQRVDGSWLYAPEDEKSFIDCFHSCFILKNIFKTNEIIKLSESNGVIDKGIEYLIVNFYDSSKGLFKRFSISNKLSFVKFDLYDNAEVLSLFKLTGRRERSDDLFHAIQRTFVQPNGIYSGVDNFNNLLNKNFLRWAVMPYFLALSTPNK